MFLNQSNVIVNYFNKLLDFVLKWTLAKTLPTFLQIHCWHNVPLVEYNVLMWWESAFIRSILKLLFQSIFLFSYYNINIWKKSRRFCEWIFLLPTKYLRRGTYFCLRPFFLKVKKVPTPFRFYIKTRLKGLIIQLDMAARLMADGTGTGRSRTWLCANLWL